jgi:2-polyprenyl-3-methyl-5-hydroxy-6-metoxy-1,4-benzoquinol methylase
MDQSDLISPEYLQEQCRLHAEPRGYGQRGHKWSAKVNEIIWVHQCASVLDYGCGQGSLVQSLRLTGRKVNGVFVEYQEYDPAIPEKDLLPAPADLVICTDVLEHVEDDKIGAVLAHLCGLVRKRLFVVISLVETAKTLSDGRQAHILLRSPDWWRNEFERRGMQILQEPQIKPEKQWVALLQP